MKFVKKKTTGNLSLFQIYSFIHSFINRKRLWMRKFENKLCLWTNQQHRKKNFWKSIELYNKNGGHWWMNEWMNIVGRKTNKQTNQYWMMTMITTIDNYIRIIIHGSNDFIHFCISRSIYRTQIWLYYEYKQVIKWEYSLEKKNQSILILLKLEKERERKKMTDWTEPDRMR